MLKYGYSCASHLSSLPGGHRLHRVKWWPQVTWFFTFHQSSRCEWISLSHLVSWPRGPGLWQVQGHQQYIYSSYYHIKKNIGLILSFISSSDKMFPAFGFGAQVPPSWQVNEMTSAAVTVTNSQKPLFTIVVFSRCLMSFLSTSIPQIHTVQVFYNISLSTSAHNRKWCV